MPDDSTPSSQHNRLRVIEGKKGGSTANSWRKAACNLLDAPPGTGDLLLYLFSLVDNQNVLKKPIASLVDQGWTERTARRQLQALVEAGFVRMGGQTNGRYLVLNPAKWVDGRYEHRAWHQWQLLEKNHRGGF